jgi:hypothetical protein
VADGTVLNGVSVAGGDTIATDDIAGVKHQYVKVEYGADNAATPVSDANPLPTADPAVTATEATVAGSASSVTILAANASRKKGTTIRNDSSAVLYLSFGNVATTAAPVRLVSQDTYELPVRYLGAINGIWESATGNARTLEFA